MKNELIKLVSDGRLLFYHIALTEGKLNEKEAKNFKKYQEYQEFERELISIKSNYQKWYSMSIQVIKQLLPERLAEFQDLYHNEKRNNKNITYLTYSISDYLLNLKITDGWDIKAVDGAAACISKMEQQIEILNSCLQVFDSKLKNIIGVLQSELFENELETAKNVLKKKHYRLAGALAGIVLEGHLKEVCNNHQIKFKKSNPTISDYNEELKQKERIDLPTWRLIQRLGDIRNMSVHAKEREPKPDEIEDLIRGCEKLISELI
ncbi:MAG: hypothetical protein NT175_11065 [Bacteroidetes bacterium]|nr:hypothetical protein [Bacteroidota bacterium]